MPTEWPCQSPWLIHNQITKPGRWRDKNGNIAIVTDIDADTHFHWKNGDRSQHPLKQYHDRFWTYFGPLEDEKKCEIVVTEVSKTIFRIKQNHIEYSSITKIAEVDANGNITWVYGTIRRETPEFLRSLATVITQVADLSESLQK